MTGIADLQPLRDQAERRREQRAWYWYDWANSAYVTTTAAVLFAPYLTAVAERDACGFAGTEDRDCTQDLSIAGVSVDPGSLAFYLITASTLFSAFLLPVVGAMADRSAQKVTLLGRFATVGGIAAMSMFFVTGSNWQLGAGLLLVATLSLGCSLVVYDAILTEVALPEERDRVSSRGWALGYLGGGLLLATNFALLSVMSDTDLAVRICLLTAGAWWIGFTLIPLRGLKNRPPKLAVSDGDASALAVARGAFAQLWRTLRELRAYPVTLTFLLAYLFYNDGIQTVIYAASIFGEKELGFEKSTVLIGFLVVQFIGVGGALLFARVAARIGTRETIMAGLVLWLVIVSGAYFVPEQEFAYFLALAASIGLVLGGTQALSRSFFSQLIPHGREAEYFSLYQACERGTSWLGTLVFGIVHQATDSYRPALLALAVFFLLGLILLSRVNLARGREMAAAPTMAKFT